MEESPEKWSLSMARSDMETVDRIASKMGLSRSELVKRAVAKYARDNNLVPDYKVDDAIPSGAIEWIISRSHGPLGDFKMAWCATLMARHGLAGKLSGEDLRKILGRYREHVDFWAVPDAAVTEELKEFSSRAKVEETEVWRIFYSLGVRTSPEVRNA